MSKILATTFSYPDEICSFKVVDGAQGGWWFSGLDDEQPDDTWRWTASGKEVRSATSAIPTVLYIKEGG